MLWLLGLDVMILMGLNVPALVQGKLPHKQFTSRGKTHAVNLNESDPSPPGWYQATKKTCSAQCNIALPAPAAITTTTTHACAASTASESAFAVATALLCRTMAITTSCIMAGPEFLLIG